MAQSTEYRWNSTEAIQAYDAAAHFIHPRYLEIQDEILRILGQRSDETPLIVDAGGGSGRLIDRILDALPQATGVVVDQSEPFLAYSAVRLRRFGPRAHVVQARLQDDWGARLPAAPTAIVSTSAIHHLEPAEKQQLFARCHAYLAPGSVFINGDEIRQPTDAGFRQELQQWADHMYRELATGRIPAAFAEMVDKWRRRNIDEFDAPKHSGDDCLETIDTQLSYLRAAGFWNPRVTWQQQMWAVFVAER